MGSFQDYILHEKWDIVRVMLTFMGVFTYYVITEVWEGGVSKMLTHDYGGGGGELASRWHKQKQFFSQNEIVLKQKTVNKLICFSYQVFL